MASQRDRHENYYKIHIKWLSQAKLHVNQIQLLTANLFKISPIQHRIMRIACIKSLEIILFLFHLLLMWSHITLYQEHYVSKSSLNHARNTFQERCSQ